MDDGLSQGIDHELAQSPWLKTTKASLCMMSGKSPKPSCVHGLSAQPSELPIRSRWSVRWDDVDVSDVVLAEGRGPAGASMRWPTPPSSANKLSMLCVILP